MKRLFTLLLALLVLVSICPAVRAAEADIGGFALPTPQAPNYFVFSDGDGAEGHHDDLRMYMVADPDVALLAAEYNADSEAFCETYGLWSFEIVMQYDVSLDGEDNWQHTPEWDSEYYTGGYADGYPYMALRSEMVEDFEFFWLTYHEGQGSETFKPYQPAIVTEQFHYDDGSVGEAYSFDVENHSLYIRCRYYMEWEPLVEYGEGWGPGEKQSKFSDWSESAVFGKDSTGIIPSEPEGYEAPVISDLVIALDEGDENCHLEYVQTTPDSLWMAYIHYEMTQSGQFDGLQTQVSIDGGDWVEFSTYDSDGDWCLHNGDRSAGSWDYPIGENSWVRLRVRFNGTHGPSEWSNVLEVNGGGSAELPGETQSVPEPPAATEPAPSGPEPQSCSLCGFCPKPLGLCILIWLAIAAAVLLLLAIAARKKKCPHCRAKYKKRHRCCPNCGKPVRK